MFSLQKFMIFFLIKEILLKNRNNKNFYIENVKCKNQIYVHLKKIKKKKRKKRHVMASGSN